MYKRYVNDLYRYLISLSKDHFIAEDLVQDAFYRAYLALADYEISNIKAWLFKVAYHAFIDYQRKNKRIIIENTLNTDDTVEESAEKNMLARESLRLLLKDLNLLKHYEKQAILLCDFHELTYQEAAEILELKLNTFKSHLRRGRKKLLTIVKERMEKDEG